MVRERTSYSAKDFDTSDWSQSKYAAALLVIKDPAAYSIFDEEITKDPDIALLTLSNMKIPHSELRDSFVAELEGKPSEHGMYIGMLAAAKKDYRVGIMIDEVGEQDFYLYLPDNVKRHPLVINNHLNLYDTGYCDLPEDIKKSRNIWKSLASKSIATNYAAAPEEIRSDWKLSLKALNRISTLTEFTVRRNELQKDGYYKTVCEHLSAAEMIKRYVPESLRKDKESIKKLIFQNSCCVKLCDKELLKDREFLDFVINHSPLTIKNGPELPDEIKNDRELALKYAPVSKWYAVSAAKNFSDDEKVMLTAINGCKLSSIYLWASDRLKNDREFNVKCMWIYPFLYSAMNKEMKNDQEIFELYITASSDDRSQIKETTEGLVWTEEKIRFALDIDEQTFAREIPLDAIKDISPVLPARLAEEYPTFEDRYHKLRLRKSKALLEEERSKGRFATDPREETASIVNPVSPSSSVSKPETNISLPDDIKITGVTLITKEEYDLCCDLFPPMNAEWWLKEKGFVTVRGQTVMVTAEEQTCGVRVALEYEGDLPIGDKKEILGKPYTPIFGNKLLSNEFIGISSRADVDRIIHQWYDKNILPAEAATLAAPTHASHERHSAAVTSPDKSGSAEAPVKDQVREETKPRKFLIGPKDMKTIQEKLEEAVDAVLKETPKTPHLPDRR